MLAHLQHSLIKSKKEKKLASIVVGQMEDRNCTLLDQDAIDPYLIEKDEELIHLPILHYLQARGNVIDCSINDPLQSWRKHDS